MKYKVGDKVKYDGGDWWFYGTVSAVFEHSICPCYRLNVERMEKKYCKFSITQFEFELEAVGEVEKSPRAIEEKRQMIRQEPELEEKKKPEPEKVELIQQQVKMQRLRKTTDAWDKNLELYRNGKKSNVLNAWKSKNRKDYLIGILSKDKIEKLMEINFPFDVERKIKPITITEKVELTQKPGKESTKRKKRDAWDDNFEAYTKGEKSNLINTWVSYNRKQYKDGTLPDDKFEKLVEINFPFDAEKKIPNNSWDRQLEEWKKGDRKSIKIQQWKQRSIRKFVEGKLSSDRIAKLKEVGILK